MGAALELEPDRPPVPLEDEAEESFAPESLCERAWRVLERRDRERRGDGGGTPVIHRPSDALLVEAERQANEVVAELRGGARLRDALDAALLPANDLGDEDAPVNLFGSEAPARMPAPSLPLLPPRVPEPPPSAVLPSRVVMSTKTWALERVREILAKGPATAKAIGEALGIDSTATNHALTYLRQSGEAVFDGRPGQRGVPWRLAGDKRAAATSEAPAPATPKTESTKQKLVPLNGSAKTARTIADVAERHALKHAPASAFLASFPPPPAYAATDAFARDLVALRERVIAAALKRVQQIDQLIAGAGE